MRCMVDLKILLAAALLNALSNAQTMAYEFNDSHFHLTNYIQEGTDIHDFLKIMGNRVGRVAIFGIPLQQQWSYRVDGDNAPIYYSELRRSFVLLLVHRRMDCNGLQIFPEAQRGTPRSHDYGLQSYRYVCCGSHSPSAADFPGVFSGIGEFTIHKEFVSAKIAGEVASLQDPASDRILDFAAEVGLVVLIHNDIDVPFAKEGSPAGVSRPDAKAVFKRHPTTTIIWAHTGVGRVVRPIKNHAANLRSDPAVIPFSAMYTSIFPGTKSQSISSPAQRRQRSLADLMNRYPDRFLFGTDEVAPASESSYLRVFKLYAPLWNVLTPATSEKVRKTNYEHIFDEARHRVRTWESSHARAAKAP